MSEFHVEVVRINKVARHPNADTLEITTVRGGYTCIFKEGQYKPGQLAVFVPEDALVPIDDPRWSFLKGKSRIRASRIRGIFSMGVLTSAEPGWIEGQNVQNELGIKKWEPELPVTARGDCEKDPGFLPVYTDIESYRRWPKIIQPGEDVVLTEKIHGCNSRYLYHENRLWVGSHTQIKKENDTNLWWRAARIHNLEEKLKTIPGIVVYGECYGQVQKGFQYGIPSGESRIILFDALDVGTRKFLDYDDFIKLAKQIDMPVVPVIYDGPWSDELINLSNGPSLVSGSSNIREGFVIRPRKERWDAQIGRVILKYVGEDYLVKKHR